MATAHTAHCVVTDVVPCLSNLDAGVLRTIRTLHERLEKSAYQLEYIMTATPHLHQSAP